MEKEKIITEIKELKKRLDVTIVSHFYQKDEVFEFADFTGDSLQLAQIAAKDKQPNLIFCGVGFMGESVKILDPNKRVFMPKLACCSMAMMIDGVNYDKNVKILNDDGIPSENILPITYINSSAEVKARVGKMGGLVCTSSNAKKIITKALESGKKILFVPDRCLGQNIANEMGLKSAIIGIDKNLKDADVLCYDGFCSVHQLFTTDDIDFYRAKYPDIKILTHPECDPSVCQKSDFVGSTSQIIEYVNSLPLEQKVAIGTEYNLVNRMREKNTFVLSSTKPQCPTMNETTLEDLYLTLKAIEEGNCLSEVFVDNETVKWAKIALERMFEL